MYPVCLCTAVFAYLTTNQAMTQGRGISLHTRTSGFVPEAAAIASQPVCVSVFDTPSIL